MERKHHSSIHPKEGMTNEGKEKIKCAGVRYEGKIFEGSTHVLALEALLKYLGKNKPTLYGKVHGDTVELVEELAKQAHGDFHFEGFVTESGRYVTREEALEIARANNRVHVPSSKLGGELHSEDLDNT